MALEKVRLEIDGKIKRAILKTMDDKSIKVFNNGDVIKYNYNGEPLVFNVQIKHSELRVHSKNKSWTYHEGIYKWSWKTVNPDKGILVNYVPPNNTLEAWLDDNNYGYSLKHMHYINERVLKLYIYNISDKNASHVMVFNDLPAGETRYAEVTVNPKNNKVISSMDNTFTIILLKTKTGFIINHIIVSRAASYAEVIRACKLLIKDASHIVFDGSIDYVKMNR